MQFKDGEGNVSETASDGIVLDMTSPTGTVIINDGAEHANSNNVTLKEHAYELTMEKKVKRLVEREEKKNKKPQMIQK